MRRGSFILSGPCAPVLVAASLLILAALPLMGQESAPPRRFEIVLEQGRLREGPRTLKVTRGERVDIAWRSDVPVTLHLHGYDIEIPVAPGEPRSMAFTADATGRFPVAIHGSAGGERILVYVEVHPR